MAGLDLNLEGLSLEQLQGAADFQKKLAAARGAAAAAAPGVATTGATPASALDRATAGLADANRAARVAQYGTGQVAKMEAAGSRFGGAAPSIPTETNPAPVSTAAAANAPSFGQRVMNALRLTGRLTAGVAGGVQAATGGYQLGQGNVGEGIENAALGVATAVNPVVGLIGNGLAGVRDFVMRRVIDNVFGTNRTFIPQPEGSVKGPTPAAGTTIPAGTTAYPSILDAPREAQQVLTNDKPVPADGTGVAINNRTGRTFTFNTGAAAAAAPAAAAPATATTPIKAPQLGTEGGIFSNLVPFVNQVNQQKVEAAAGNRDYKRAITEANLGVSRAKVGIEAENAVSKRIDATARTTAALAKVRDAGVKVVQDAAGNPVVVNTSQNRATVLTPNKPVTEADITTTMKNNKLTRAQVIERLKAEGRIDPNYQ